MIYEIYKILEKPYSSNYGNLVQKLLLFNILLNIFVSLFGDFVNLSDSVKQIFLNIEYLTVFIFFIELISRYIVIGKNKNYQGFLGRVKFTFTPFIIIDIISLIPYFIGNIDSNSLLVRVIRFIKYFRTLKLLRLKNVIKNFLNISSFATSTIFMQFVILFIFSIFFISLFSFVFDNEKLSMMVFLDPPALAEVENHTQLVFGIIELILGLVIGGTLISIITELLTNISRDIKNGYYPYRGKEHLIIINYNPRLEFVLNEINYFYKGTEEYQEVIIFLPFIKDIEEFYQNLKEYSNIKIFLIKGELFSWQSYEKLNINFAQKVLILQDENIDNKYINTKLTRFILSSKNFINENIDFVVESKSIKENIVFKEIFSWVNNSYNIVNFQKVIQSFLNRSIVEPEHFKIYSNLFSFKNFEIYTLDFKNIYSKEIHFSDIYTSFKSGIVIGIIQDKKLMLNPVKDFIVRIDDKLVIIMKNKYEYSVKHQNAITCKPINIRKPRLKVDKKICIIGNYDDINEKQISGFLSDKSIENLQKIVLRNPDNYKKREFWDKIIEQNFDVIILNLEDDIEFMLTVYIKNIYKNNKSLLNSIVNIMHDPINAKLLLNMNTRNNILLSERLVGKFLSQVLFNKNILKIFDEITDVKGNELYIFNRDDYKELFDMNFEDLKLNLFFNDMIYIGVMKNNDFIVNHESTKKIDSIVVLTRGV